MLLPRASNTGARRQARTEGVKETGMAIVTHPSSKLRAARIGRQTVDPPR